MYHSPVQPEEAQQEDSAPILPEAAAGDAAASRLREAYLYTGQAKARALFAPFLAISAVAAALLVGWAMLGHVGLELIAPWLAAVGLANWTACRRATREAFPDAPRLGRKWPPVAEAMGLAALWASLPTWAFATQAPQVQVVIGGAMGAMIIGAIALAAFPAAATAWVATLTAAFCIAFFLGSRSLDLTLALTFIGVAAMAVYSVTRLTRWTYDQLDRTAKASAERESARLLLRQYERHGVGWLWQVDAENRLVYISPRVAALVGRAPGQLAGHSFPAVLGGSGPLGQALLARTSFANLEIEVRSREGIRWIGLSGDPVIDVAGQFQGYRGVATDVTDVRKTQERLTKLANIDVLSGLPNRGRVRQLLGEALSAAQSGSAPCAVMFLDLDAFKPVNDTFGHLKGDQVLKNVAQRLLKEVGRQGHVGRMGGDEFAVVLAEAANRRAIEELARRIIAAVAEPFTIDKTEIRIGVSVGCAVGPTDGTTVDDLIQKADLALYQAKAQGRGRFCHFSADMQNEAEGRRRLERDMREGIKSGQFRLLYQPLVDASTQSLTGFEALIRWHHPSRGIIPPLEFIPLAEESGIIIPLGEWVIEEACRAASHWRSGVTVAVNVSAHQLASPSLPGTVREALSKAKVPADRLELEVTESVFLGDTNGALDMLQRLRALGLGIALDDFGTGYSSLGYLNKAVFHKLKIDGSFVREAAKNQETVAIIQSIVALAKNFRMTVTAEGVETSEDFARMRDLGCHHIQGYLFGKPMSFEDATALANRGWDRQSA
ncbi:MAG TPA: EAL domain-containing protein [Allosphingosinicella sp.]|nr:EAL domain-containing protein [Allosphingosinicella sp.]